MVSPHSYCHHTQASTRGAAHSAAVATGCVPRRPLWSRNWTRDSGRSCHPTEFVGRFTEVLVQVCTGPCEWGYRCDPASTRKVRASVGRNECEACSRAVKPSWHCRILSQFFGTTPGRGNWFRCLPQTAASAVAVVMRYHVCVVTVLLLLCIV